MSYTRTNYRVTGAQINDDAVTSAKIAARAVVASSIATAIVAQSHLATNARFAKGYQAAAQCSSTGTVRVSTGLASPVYAMAFEKTSGTVANRFKKLRFFSAAGSYVYFQLHAQTYTTTTLHASVTVYLFQETLYAATATIQFNWLAFEA
ncbi:MAG: hypothetical protein HWN68_20485 [Desulfobacterales bacterium]|nr:hypothetical protein [Desulfobacterales bacterium]